jgi:hypothetical protein
MSGSGFSKSPYLSNLHKVLIWVNIECPLVWYKSRPINGSEPLALDGLTAECRIILLNVAIFRFIRLEYNPSGDCSGIIIGTAI